MRSFVHRAILGGVVLGLASVAACSNSGTPAPALGTVGFQLATTPGVTITTVNWSISNAGTGFSRSGTVNVQSSNTISFQVGGLPSGSGYVIALTATTVGGAFSCAGSSPFTVTAGVTSGVSVTLACTAAAPDAGSVLVTGTTVVCPSVTAVSAAPLETAVNSTIALSATASAGASAPTFTWTATAGSFDNPARRHAGLHLPGDPGDGHAHGQRGTECSGLYVERLGLARGHL